MTTIVKRIAKGSTLTVAELDANVTNLNNTKLETTGGTLTGLPVLANQDVDIISPVYPTTKPSLNLDFTRGQLDPRVTFARNSGGAYYDGQTSALAEQNLVTQSQTFSTWTSSGTSVTANTTTAPDGTATGASLVELATTASHSIFLGVGTVGLTYTQTVYAKANTRNWLKIVNYVTYANFDLTNGVIGSYNTAGVPTITSVGNGWYRCTMSLTTALASYMQLNVGSGNVASYIDSYVGDGTSGIYIWGAQLEQRSSATAYTPTTTAAITNYIPVLMTAPAGVARFDCDPITGKSLGLLIEESRTNLLTYSSDFSNGVWNKLGSSYVGNSAIAPDGTQTAGYLFEDTGATNHSVYQNFSGVAGTTYTLTVYAKAKERYCVYVYAAGSNSRVGVGFNLNTGAVRTNYSNGSFGAPISNIIPVGNGWYRCSVSFVCSIMLFNVDIGIDDGVTFPTGANLTYNGNGYSGIYIWGAQIEANSSQAIRNSVLGSGSTTTDIVLDAGASAVTGTYVGNLLSIGTGAQIISAYNGTTKTATLSTAFGSAFPVNTPYVIVPATMTPSGFATSYIPTVASTVTRVADSALMTGTNFSSWYNQAQGSLYCEADLNQTNPTITAMFIEGGASDGSSGTICSISTSSGSNMRLIVRNTTVNPIGDRTIPYTFVVNASIKTAILYNNLSGLTCALNGVTYTGTNSVTGSSTPDKISIGSRVGSSLFINGHIRKLTYYPVALSSANLVALTS